MKSIKKTLNEISSNFSILAEKFVPKIEEASKLLINSFQRGGKIVFCGKSGSAPDAQHFSQMSLGGSKRFSGDDGSA